MLHDLLTVYYIDQLEIPINILWVGRSSPETRPRVIKIIINLGTPNMHEGDNYILDRNFVLITFLLSTTNKVTNTPTQQRRLG